MNFTFSSQPTIFRAGCVTFYNADTIGGTANTVNENLNPARVSTAVTLQGTSGMVVDFFYVTAWQSGGDADVEQTEVMNNAGSWSSGAADHMLGISYEAHTGTDPAMAWDNLLYAGGGPDQVHVVVEILPKEFKVVPQICIV